MDPLAHLGCQGDPDLVVPLEALVLRERWDLPDLMDDLVDLDLKDQRAMQALMDFLELRVDLVYQG